MKIINKVSANLASVLLTALLLNGCATTTPTNMSSEAMYKEGEQFFQRERYEDAIAQWKKVKESYQSPELVAQAEINIANAYFLNGDYIESAAAYEDFRKMHPGHAQAGFSLYRQGLSYYKQIHGIDTDQTPVKNALTIFESYPKLYPTGEQLGDVQEKIRDCRDKQLQYEIYVGRFYLKTGAYKSAIGRFESAIATFQDLPGREAALYYLGRAYFEDGQKSKGRQTFSKLSQDFPNSSFISDANKTMDSFF